MTWIQRGLPLFVAAKGYYLLPAVAGALIVLRYALAVTRRERAMRGLMIAVAATAGFSVPVYFNFFNYHFGGFVNPHEFFHYYLGSKYAAEVGYFDLYDAAIVADDETGLAFRPVDGSIRDLTTYGDKPVRKVLAEADRLRSRFTPGRWREWVHDVLYFKRRLRGPSWSETLRDMGYNATPVWSMLVGAGLTSRVATDDATGMTFLALLDVLLLASAAGCVLWAFGAWPALLMIVFLASSYLMAHVHMKGALLRTDFVVALVMAMALLRKGRHGLAGALVGYSTSARVFPLLFLFGPGVKLVTELVPVAREAWRRFGKPVVVALIAAHAAAGAVVLPLVWLAVGSGMRRVVTTNVGSAGGLYLAALVPVTVALAAVTLTLWGTREKLLAFRHARFFGGFVLTVAVLGSGSMLYAGGPRAWEGFAQKIALHRTTYNFWNIGVTSIVIARFDPPGPREQAVALRPPELRAWLGNVYFLPETVGERAWLSRILQLAALIAAWLAARRFDDALAFAFGFVATFFLTAPTYYYYIILLIPFLFFASHPDRLRGTLGLLYLFLFGALGFTFYFLWDQYFTTYFWNSVLALGVTIAMIASAFGRMTPWAASPVAAAARPARRSR